MGKKIEKVSDITANDVASYLRIEEYEDDLNTLNTLITVSKEFISKYTGIKQEDLDKYQDFIIVVFVLCQDMYDNRSLYVDKSNLNKVVESVLDLHSTNLL